MKSLNNVLSELESAIDDEVSRLVEDSMNNLDQIAIWHGGDVKIHIEPMCDVLELTDCASTFGFREFIVGQAGFWYSTDSVEPIEIAKYLREVADEIEGLAK